MTMRHWLRPLLVACLLVLGLDARPADARRVALVIGNADYKIGRLANPVNDAVAVAAAFETQLKFDRVILRTNVGINDFRAALAELAREASGADLGVVYFAGHGTEVAGRNFLIPVDATLGRPGALELEAVPLDTVLGQLEGVRKLRLVILDACRNNLFPLPGARRSVGRGLARIEPEGTTLVVYAAKDGTTADDGSGGHSPFTTALLRHIAAPSLEVRFLFGQVADDVAAATGQMQQPYLYGNLGGKQFYLRPETGSPTAPDAMPPANAAAEAWAAVKDSTSIAQLEVVAGRFKGTVYADLAQARISELKGRDKGTQLALAVPPAPQAIAPPVTPPPLGGPRYISFAGTQLHSNRGHRMTLNEGSWVLKVDGDRIFAIAEDATLSKSLKLISKRSFRDSRNILECPPNRVSRRRATALGDSKFEIECRASRQGNQWQVDLGSVIAMDAGSTTEHTTIKLSIDADTCALISYDRTDRFSQPSLSIASTEKSSLTSASCKVLR